MATYAYNIKPHPATGFTPFELVTAVPQSSLSAQVVLTPRRREKSKAELRNDFLAKVAECSNMARENLAVQQKRYKRAYDAHVRVTTSDLSVGDWAYVRTYVAPRELSRKLIFPAVGPFVVTKVGPDRRTFRVNTADGEVTVAADRVRKCPWPQDLPEGMEFTKMELSNEAKKDEYDEESLGDMTEYVIDHIISHRRDSSGSMLLKIRWFGYDSREDTWEPIFNIPPELVRRYVKRRRLNDKDFEVQPADTVN